MENHSYPRTLNIAHRGARSHAPENTLAAARKAYEIGADMWELDVCMTSDGELILLHDDTLERTSNAPVSFPSRFPWRVSDFTLEEIRQLDFGSWFNLTDPYGQINSGHITLPERLRFTGEPAPSLKDALIFTKEYQWKVNVEIKDLSGTNGHLLVVEKVVKLVQDLEMQSAVMISSFQHEYLKQIRAFDKSIKTAALVDDCHPDPVGLLKTIGAQGYNPNKDAISPEEISYLRDKGIEVYIYTVNDPTEMAVLAKANASGLFTDYPQVLKEVLASLD